MKKQHLLPPGKGKKIIYLEERGRKKREMSGWSVLFAVTAVVCLLYCLSIALFMGYGTSFFLIWSAIAVGCGFMSWLLSRRSLMERIPKWLKRIFMVCVACGLLLFGTIEGMIFSQFGAEAQSGADYVIVLGAQWKANGPSYVLQKRLDKALDYLNANPDATVIVSGGKGSNEPVSEAEGMYGYLVAAGISPEQIIKEDQSTNTYENLLLSSEYLDKANDKVVLVTNNFHVFRARGIALKQGYEQVEGLAAESYPAMLPNNLLREFFGVIKDFLVGNI